MPLSFAPGWTKAHPREYESILAQRLKYPTPRGCWAAQFRACERFLAKGVPVEEIVTSALVIHGDQDRVVPVDNGHRLASRLQKARLSIISGGGHLSFIEDPDTFNSLLFGFLA
jgi:3-oxoadipate enol-lactonase